MVNKIIIVFLIGLLVLSSMIIIHQNNKIEIDNEERGEVEEIDVPYIKSGFEGLSPTEVRQTTSIGGSDDFVGGIKYDRVD